MKVGNDNIVQKLTLAQAIDTTDALAKSIYSCLFDWLVEQINKSLAAGKYRTGRSISILDIYGFESFDKRRNIFKMALTGQNWNLKTIKTLNLIEKVKGLVIMHNQIWGFLWPYATAAFMENKVMVSLLRQSCSWVSDSWHLDWIIRSFNYTQGRLRDFGCPRRVLKNGSLNIIFFPKIDDNCNNIKQKKLL
ncbi:hypothetical protein L1987_23655 [Smallanthus sonchifolius]|uniref:Uncharacterized protein n=1 Tax=Smallanthus sonchifolius TaxID=185202 RepID=A0ACB9IJQ4_9ASTR|nr:hypothetical protein L1987_23655 [Smallanthus sonchifolius]